MGLIIVYLPRQDLSSSALWEQIRSWQKQKSIAWDRLRLTPDFYHAGGLEREEMAATLDLVRLGQVERIVYTGFQAGQTENFDWLAFVLSLQRYATSIETMAGEALDLEKSLHTLTSSFNKLKASSETRSPRA